MQPHQEDEDLSSLLTEDEKTALRDRMLQIERRIQELRCEEYRCLLEDYVRRCSVDREVSAADPMRHQLVRVCYFHKPFPAMTPLQPLSMAQQQS